MSQVILGISIIWITFLVIWGLKRSFFINIENESEVLLFKFGKLIKKFNKPGLEFCPHILPWLNVVNVSKKIDHRHYTELQVNDAKGTAMVVDLWVEFKILDSQKALFQVEDWEESMRSLVINYASSFLSSHEFKSIHTNRLELANQIKSDLHETTYSWGIELSNLFIRKISLNQEISHQLLNAVAAKLERLKANIEEEGRLKVAIMEADTQVKIAELHGHAKGKYPQAISRAYKKLSQNSKIINSYKELFNLTQIRPHRTTIFHGFNQKELNATDATLIKSSNYTLNTNTENLHN